MNDGLRALEISRIELVLLTELCSRHTANYLFINKYLPIIKCSASHHYPFIKKVHH